MRSSWCLIFLLGSLSVPGQVLLSENFNNPAIAAARFSTFGTVQYTAGQALLGANSAIILNSANSIPDTGASPIQFSIQQTFGAGTYVYPNYHEGDFYVRMDHSQSEYYQIVTFLDTLGAYIGINRVTTNEPGVISTTIVGGSMYAPPILSTIGPYVISVAISDAPDSVTLDVSINGVHAISAQDTSPYRLTAGDTLAYAYSGTRSEYLDNLVVTLIPEPAALTLLGLGLCFHLGLRSNARSDGRRRLL